MIFEEPKIATAMIGEILLFDEWPSKSKNLIKKSATENWNQNYCVRQTKNCKIWVEILVEISRRYSAVYSGPGAANLSSDTINSKPGSEDRAVEAQSHAPMRMLLLVWSRPFAAECARLTSATVSFVLWCQFSLRKWPLAVNCYAW